MRPFSLDTTLSQPTLAVFSIQIPHLLRARAHCTFTSVWRPWFLFFPSSCLLRLGVAADRTTASAYTPFDLTPPPRPPGWIFDNDAIAAVKQETLLAAASWLFNLKGIGATSLDEIAASVGVSKKVISHNVGDKTALIRACYVRSISFYDDLAMRAISYRGSRIEALCATWHASGEASLREDIAPIPLAMGFESLPDSSSKCVHGEAARLQDLYLSL